MARPLGSHCLALVAAGLLGCALSARVAAEEPLPRYAVHLQDSPAPNVASAPTKAPLTVVLDGLENQLVSAEAGNSSVDLAAVVATAQQSLVRAATASERIRIRRVLRRIKHLQDGTSAQQFDAALVSYSEPTMTTAPSSRLVDPMLTTPAGTSPRLERLAQLAARLAQYGAPATEDPSCAQMPMPVATAVACVPPPSRHYIQLDALGWWMTGDSLPALVTGSPSNTPLDEAGILGLPTTSVLFGNQSVNGSLRWGGRVQGGVWLDDFQTFAVEGSYLGFPTVTTSYSRTSIFSDGSTADPILARPYFNTSPGVNEQDALLFAFPGLVVPPDVIDVDGTIDIREQSSFQSAGIGGRWAFMSYDSPFRAILVGGYRFVDLNESLSIETNSSATITPFPIPVPDDGTIQVVDSFGTRNIFNGGELGMIGEYTRGRWSVAFLKRVALGNMNQQVKIDGRTSAIWQTYTASYEGGLLAQPSNIGTFTRNRFAWVPELDLKLGYQLLPALRLTVGYNLTYVSSVVRPGGQIDTNVNNTQIAGLPLVGPADPAVTMNTSHLWLQGFTTGIDLRF